MPEKHPLGEKPDAAGSFAEMGMPHLGPDNPASQLDFEAQDAAAAAEEEPQAEPEPQKEEAPVAEPEPEPREVSAKEAPAEDEELSPEQEAAKVYEQFAKVPEAPKEPELSPVEKRMQETIDRQERLLEQTIQAMNTRITEAPAVAEPEPEQPSSIWQQPAVVNALQDAIDSGEPAKLAAVMAEVDSIRQKELVDAATQPLREEMESERRVAKAQEALTERMNAVWGSLGAAAKKSPLHLKVVQDFQQRGGDSPLGQAFSADRAVLGSRTGIVGLVDSIVLDARQGFNGGPVSAGAEVTATTAASGRNAGRNRMGGDDKPTEPTKEEEMKELFGEKPEFFNDDIFRPS